ncbi:MAG: type I methionyl aminopeptidase [Steroidobacteraceae bacterium]|nr:type I methionyl aminopeptidase [Steroidobacteraceae bacterium]
MTIESDQDLQGLRSAGRVVALALATMRSSARAGMTTAELDAIGENILRAHGARSAPRVTYGFPGTTCISINEEVAHGVPGERVIQPGDMVNVDVSAELNGYFADTGASFIVPPSTPEKERLCRSTQMALEHAMEHAVAGGPLNAIGKAIEATAKRQGFRVIRNLGSHGVGRALHEEPSCILPYYEPRDRRRLHEGMVITIEPFLSTRARHATEADDGWTLKGPPGTFAAQYEHTLVITRGKPLVMTAL